MLTVSRTRVSDIIDRKMSVRFLLLFSLLLHPLPTANVSKETFSLPVPNRRKSMDQGGGVSIYVHTYYVCVHTRHFPKKA